MYIIKSITFLFFKVYMTKIFTAKFCPTSISEETLKTILTEIFNTENFIVHEGFTVDYLNDFYKNFDFSILINIVDFINTMRFDSTSLIRNTSELIDISYINLPIVLKESLRLEFLKNWKRPNIKKYHTFIQTCISNINSSIFFNNKLRSIIFDTWRNIDNTIFEEYLKNITYDEYYTELKKIEFDFVELLI